MLNSSQPTQSTAPFGNEAVIFLDDEVDVLGWHENEIIGDGTDENENRGDARDEEENRGAAHDDNEIDYEGENEGDTEGETETEDENEGDTEGENEGGAEGENDEGGAEGNTGVHEKHNVAGGIEGSDIDESDASYDHFNDSAFENDEDDDRLYDENVTKGLEKDGTERCRTPVFDANIHMEVPTEPKFEVGMLFKDNKAFKDAVKNHSIAIGRTIIPVKNEKFRIRMRCQSNCPWVIYASKYRDDEDTYSPS